MRRLASRQAVRLCCAVLAGGLVLSLLNRAQTEESQPATGYEQVLILKSLGIITGKMTRSPNGFVVERPGGHLVVPYEQVRVTGKNLHDGYLRLRESIVEPTAQSHYELALWCQEHKLPNEAREELIIALDRDPDHEASRDLLRRLDAAAAAVRRSQMPPAPEVRTFRGKEIPAVESLGGLSQGTAQMYTLKVQPILHNKCSKAGCHSSNSEREFKLEAMRGTGPRHPVTAERNLAAIMSQIDLNDPAASPLLQACNGQHGGGTRPIFAGPDAQKQRKILKDWVHMAAKETLAQQQLAEQRPSLVSPRKMTAASNKRPQTSVPSKPTEPVAGPMASIVEEDKQPEPETVDPFDPGVFNERHHGLSAEKRLPSRSRKAPTVPKETP